MNKLGHGVFFVGHFDLVVDAKNRLTIPSAVRTLLAEAGSQALYVAPNRERRVLLVYPSTFFGALRNAADVNKSSVCESELQWQLFELAQTARVEPDQQGRVVLPERLLQAARLAREVALLGVGDHLELWDRTVYTQFAGTMWERFASTARAVTSINTRLRTRNPGKFSLGRLRDVGLVANAGNPVEVALDTSSELPVLSDWERKRECILAKEARATTLHTAFRSRVSKLAVESDEIGVVGVDSTD